nr:unnamed protein product [Callosobruchus analis]
MNNLSEGKAVVKIRNLNREATEDGMKELITVLVQLKGKIQDVAFADLINGDRNYGYMFFEFECDAKQAAATLDGLPYRSCILKATVLDEKDYSEAFSLQRKIRNTKNADQQNFNASRKNSSSSITAKRDSQDSDAQSNDKASSSSSISNEKLSSDENDKLQNEAGKTSTVCAKEKKDESQSGSTSESDTDSEDDDSESSEESEAGEEQKQITGRQYGTRNTKNPSDRGHEWRGRGRGHGRGGRAQRSGARWNNNNRDRRQNIHNNPDWSHERSNRGHPFNPSRNFNASSHLFKGSDFRQSNIQNHNYQTDDAWTSRGWNTPSNVPFMPNYTPFNTNNQSQQHPFNAQGFPNYSIPPPNFSPPANQYNQQNYGKSHMGSDYNNKSDKNINVSITWNKERSDQCDNNSNRPNTMTGSTCNTSQNQPSINTYSTYKQQSLDNANKQRTNYQACNEQSDNRTSIDTTLKASSHSTEGRPRGPPVPARVKVQQTVSSRSTTANTGVGSPTSMITPNSQSTAGRIKPPVPSRTPIRGACTSSTTSTAPVSRPLPNIDRADIATARLNVGATVLSTRPSIADKKKTDNKCIIS